MTTEGYEPYLKLEMWWRISFLYTKHNKRDWELNHDLEYNEMLKLDEKVICFIIIYTTTTGRAGEDKILSAQKIICSPEDYYGKLDRKARQSQQRKAESSN